MKAVLVVNKVKSSREENIRDILMYVKMAGEHKADLIIFPEAAVTGLCLLKIII